MTACFRRRFANRATETDNVMKGILGMPGARAKRPITMDARNSGVVEVNN